MKHFHIKHGLVPVTALALLLCAFLSGCGSDEDNLTNEIDFTSPYVIADDAADPIQHERYLLYKEFGVPVFFNDTISTFVSGKDLRGNDVTTTETIDMNWGFVSHDGKDVTYRYDYYTDSEAKMKALGFARSYLAKASAKMRPFCMLLVDSAFQNSSQQNYLNGFRCLVVAHTSNYNATQHDSLATAILRTMVLSSVRLNSDLVSRFGEVSNKDKYYGRPWVVSGSNGGLGCQWGVEHKGSWWKPLELFDDGVEEMYIMYGFQTNVNSHEEFVAERTLMMQQIGKFGFICGNTDRNGQLDHLQSPASVSQDLTFFVNTILNVGRAEFMERYGSSTLVKKKFDILADYIEGELGIDLDF